MTVTADHRQRLDAIRERTRTARSRRSNARELFDAAREAEDQDAQAVAQIQLDEAATELETAEALQSQMLAALAGVDNIATNGLFDDPQTVSTLERLGNGSFPIGSLDLGPLSSVEQLVATINSGSWGQPKLAASGPVNVPPESPSRLGVHYGTVPALRRPLSILDLVPTAPMTGSAFGYLQQQPGGDHAAEVSEGQVKPEGELPLTDAEVKAQTIAVWLKALRAQLADVPALQTTIQTHLRDDVLKRLEDQIVAGNGTVPNIRGITATSGIGTVPNAAGPPSDLILDGITAVTVSGATPDAVVLHPADMAAALKGTAEGSGQRLDSGGMFSSQPTTAWGLPAIASTALPPGQALVGAWAQSCSLFIREPITVRISDSDQDDFVKNRSTILAELRAGFAVFQPAGFAVVDLAP